MKILPALHDSKRCLRGQGPRSDHHTPATTGTWTVQQKIGWTSNFSSRPLSPRCRQLLTSHLLVLLQPSHFLHHMTRSCTTTHLWQPRAKVILDHSSLKVSPGSFIPGCWLVVMVGTCQPAVGQGLAHIWRFCLGPAAFRKSKVPCPSRTSWFLTLPFAERVGRKLVRGRDGHFFQRMWDEWELSRNHRITIYFHTIRPSTRKPTSGFLVKNPTTDTAQEHSQPPHTWKIYERNWMLTLSFEMPYTLQKRFHVSWGLASLQGTGHQALLRQGRLQILHLKVVPGTVDSSEIQRWPLGMYKRSGKCWDKILPYYLVIASKSL